MAGLVLLIRRRTPGRDLAGLLDAAVIAVAAALLSWLFVVSVQAQRDEPALVKAACVAYPVMDLALLAVALRLILGSGRRPASFFLLVANMFAILTADALYVLQQLHGTYQAGNFLDAIWLAGNLALGAAALHSTMVRVGERAQAKDVSLGAGRLTALVTAVLLAPAMLLYQWARNEYDDIPVTAVACAILFGLTIARMAGLVTDQRRLAVTDALTGLHTRRFAEAHLQQGVPQSLLIIDVDHFKSINDRYGHPAGDRALVEIAARLREAARPGDVLARYGGEEFALIVPTTGVEELRGIAERLRQRVGGTPIALSADTYVAVTVSVGAASAPAAGSAEQLIAVADRALYRAKAEGRNRVAVGDARAAMPSLTVPGGQHAAMVDFLRHVADEVDAWLSPQEHSRAVGRWTRLLATELGHDEDTVTRAELAGRLHDIGKIIVPERILTKPTRLSDEEWALLRQHPDHGARLAALVPSFGAVAEVIRQHHERFDGAGYPEQLAGAGIRLEARLVAVCDSWAAMRSDRAYQPRLSVDEAREQLRLGRGTQFDPDMVDLFLDLLDRGLIGELAPGRSEVPATPLASDSTRQPGRAARSSARVFQNISS
jgi:two-component system, cell cycle response regulator